MRHFNCAEPENVVDIGYGEGVKLEVGAEDRYEHIYDNKRTPKKGKHGSGLVVQHVPPGTSFAQWITLCLPVNPDTALHTPWTVTKHEPMNTTLFVTDSRQLTVMIRELQTCISCEQTRGYKE